MLHGVHYLSPSALTYLAYHHYGATPLIFSVLTGKFEIIPILIAAGARVDIANDRGKTAADFLKQMKMPIPWGHGLEGAISANFDCSDETFSI